MEEVEGGVWGCWARPGMLTIALPWMPAVHRQPACYPQVLPAPSLRRGHPPGCRPLAAPVCGSVHHLRDAEEPEGDQEASVRARRDEAADSFSASPLGHTQGGGPQYPFAHCSPLKHGCPADTPRDGAVQDSPLTDQNPHFPPAHPSRSGESTWKSPSVPVLAQGLKDARPPYLTFRPPAAFSSRFYLLASVSLLSLADVGIGRF